MQNETSFENRYNQDIREALTKLLFTEEVSDLWKTTARAVLDCTSVEQLGCTAEDFANLLTEVGVSAIPKLNMYQFAQLNNAIPSKSALELCRSAYNYAAVVKEAADLAVKWNAIAKPISEALLKRYTEEGRKEVGKNLSANKFGGLKPVVGEA